MSNGTASTETVGVVGLGAMGLGMARNLAQAGIRVTGYDPSPVQQRLARASGIEIVDSPRSVAASATRTLISVVRTAAQTHSVLFGDDGVIHAGNPLTAVIASTLDPTTMAGLAARLQPHGITALDATMSGGPWGADAGTLTLILSGPAGAVEAVRPLTEAMGSRIFHVGSVVGTAQAAKIALQDAFAINITAVREALRIAQAHGIDARQLIDILNASVGGSWVSKNWWEHVEAWSEHYTPGGDLDILLKDVRSVLRDADARALPMPMTALAFQHLRGTGQDGTPDHGADGE